MVSAAPLAFVVPVLAATVLVAGTQVIGRRVADAFAVTIATATVVLAALTLAHAWGHRAVYWFGGWQPRGRIAVGIGFVVDPLGGALALLVAVLVLAALVYSWRYFEAAAPLFHVLMLVFLAAMVGFSLTGDLFNMFVFFELMSVAAYALTGYKTEEKGPLQGALNFAISNSVGAFLTLSGIALVYARTGALNMAQAGEQLARHGHDGLVIVAFVLIISGFLVKAAAVPFHFWLADAHAVAPVPVCLLFSGVMVQLGLYGIARVYWTVFSGVIPPSSHALVAVLVVLGLIGAVVGAAMCFAEHHIKRLLAFSTISHTGLFLVGIALLGRDGAAATALFVLAHAFVKGALFLLAGLVAHRLGSVDELALRGRGRALRWTGLGFALGGLALASLPPFGPFLGKGLLEEAAAHKGYGWVSAVFVVVSAVTGAAVLRVAGRVFLGLGGAASEAGAPEASRGEPETSGSHRRTPLVMAAPAWVLLIASGAVGVIGPIRRAAATAAAALVDRRGYDADVIGRAGRALAAVPGKHPEALAYGLGALSSVLAVVIAALALGVLPRPFAVPRRASRFARRLTLLHSGRIGDYIAWLTAGVGALGGAVALALR